MAADDGEDERQEIATRIESLYERGRRAWPELELPIDDFGSHVVSCLERDPGLEGELDRLEAESLYLCCAAARGDEKAIAAFESEYSSEVARASRRLSTGQSSDELAQLIRHKLFVGTPRRGPRIAAYAGRGSLRAWYRAVIARAVIDHRRQRSPREELTDEGDLASFSGADELVDRALMKRELRDHFGNAFRCAIADLSARERNLLRYHAIYGRSIDDIAAMYGTHRATTARWIARAKKGLKKRVQRHLRQELALSSDGFSSVIRLIDSNFHVSLGGALGSQIEADADLHDDGDGVEDP